MPDDERDQIQNLNAYAHLRTRIRIHATFLDDRIRYLGGLADTRFGTDKRVDTRMFACTDE